MPITRYLRRTLALILSLGFLAASCDSPPVVEAQPSVALVMTAGGPLPPITESRLPGFSPRSLSAGKGTVAERLGSVLAGIVAEPAIHGIVVFPAPKGSAALVAKLKEARKDIVWILADAGDEPLAAEVSADLVVDPSAGAGIAEPLGGELARGLCELARRAATGKAKPDNRGELLAALRAAGAGIEWKVEYRVDPASGVRARNHLVVGGSK